MSPVLSSARIETYRRSIARELSRMAANAAGDLLQRVVARHSVVNHGRITKGTTAGRCRESTPNQIGSLALPGLTETQAFTNMSEEEVVAFLNAEDTRRVFLFTFTDGRYVELSDPWVRVSEDGKRECIATVVREAPGVNAAAGSELCFALGEVADVRLSPRGFEYFR